MTVALATRGVISPRGGTSRIPINTDDPLLDALELSPDVYAGIHLEPKTQSAEEQNVASTPEMISTHDLIPDTTGGIDLKPVMISAKEE